MENKNSNPLADFALDQYEEMLVKKVARGVLITTIIVIGMLVYGLFSSILWVRIACAVILTVQVIGQVYYLRKVGLNKWYEMLKSMI